MLQKAILKFLNLIDQKSFIYRGIKTCSLLEYKEKRDNSLIVVCITKDCESIIESLNLFRQEDKIMLIDELLVQLINVNR